MYFNKILILQGCFSIFHFEPTCATCTVGSYVLLSALLGVYWWAGPVIQCWNPGWQSHMRDAPGPQVHCYFIGRRLVRCPFLSAFLSVSYSALTWPNHSTYGHKNWYIGIGLDGIFKEFDGHRSKVKITRSNNVIPNFKCFLIWVTQYEMLAYWSF